MKIYFSVGDPSGDLHSAPLIASLRQAYPEASFSGLGGPAMEEEGFVSFFEFEKFNKMGYVEVFRELPFFLKAKKEFVKILETEPPALLVCVDYSGFNRPLMKAARELNIPVYWYIAPMIWAWKKQKHGPFLGKYASDIGTILPFEEEHWLPFTSRVSYVGNPLLETTDYSAIDRRPLDPAKSFTLALVPGSRGGEIARLLPEMLVVAEAVVRTYPRCRVQVSKAPSADHSLFAQVPREMPLYEGPFEKLLLEADIALVTSGTATLQAALSQLPHIIMYRTSWFNALLSRYLLRGMTWIGLPNIVAGKEIIPEFVQNYTIEEIVETLLGLIAQGRRRAEMVANLAELREVFGTQAPSVRVVERLSALLESRDATR